MSMNVAIDGPAGAGKSTIARRVAEKLGYVYVDTGAMYRAMALFFLNKEIDVSDARAIEKACDDIEISIVYEDGQQKVLLNGEDVTGRIRDEKVGNTASVTSTYGCVREKLGGSSATAGFQSGCDHGRPGYRNLRAAGSTGQGLPDGQCGGSGETPVSGTGEERRGLPSGGDRTGYQRAG